MKLIKSSHKFNKTGLKNAAKQIEKAARTCYKSEDKITKDSYKELIAKLISSGHEAMLEFGPSITVKFICDRGVSHELVRHRLCDFAQESTRYCNYSQDKFDNQITFIIPCWLNDVKEGIYNHSEKDYYSIIFNNEDIEYNSINTLTLCYLKNLLNTEGNYLYLIESGWQPQQARSILPNSLKTEIVIKANIREWRHILKLRTSAKAHPQMRELMIPLLHDFKSLMPELFSDI